MAEHNLGPNAIVMDPTPRIEGHLRVDVVVGPSGVVTDAKSIAESYRGYENILKGRHPGDALQITQRICGVCPIPHGQTAAFCAENALLGEGGNNANNHKPPSDIARLTRNMVLGNEYLMSHITHFYHLAILSFVQGPNIAPFTPYFDDSYYHLLLRQAGHTLTDGTPWAKGIADYVYALGMRRTALDIAATFTGRTPMEKNLLIGGTGWRVNHQRLEEIRPKLEIIRTFIEHNYIPLTNILATLYPQYDNPKNAGGRGIGQGNKNLLSFGVFDMDMNGGDDPNRLLKRGTILGGDNSTVATLVPHLQVVEHIKYSRYADAQGKPSQKNVGTQPWDGYTNPDYSAGYGWGKAPRIRINGTDHPMQIGPLSRMAVTGARRQGNKVDYFDDYKIGDTITLPYNHATIGLGAGSFVAGVSVIDRHRARALEALKVANQMLGYTKADGTKVEGWLAELSKYPEDATTFTPWTMPKGTVRGYGAHEAPRGSLSHWVVVKDGKIDNYQAVVPTTWMAGPRDGNDVPGSFEQCCIGTPVSQVPSNGALVPVEVLRVIQSFDPCLSCTVHQVDGENLTEAKEVE